MKVLLKLPVMCLGSLVLILFGGASSLAETVCREPWAIQSMRSNQVLLVELQEKGTQGPACDFVVESYRFDEADRSISAKVRPVRFCPLDAVEERRAYLLWVLPYDLRVNNSELRLIVNERETGVLQIEQNSATFRGGCK